MDRYPCRCPVCDAVEREYGIEFITEGGGSGTSSTMNLHNLNIQLTLGREVEQLLQREGVNVVLPDGQRTDEDFWRYMRYLYDEEEVDDLTRAMAYVRRAYEDGLDVANELYDIPWSGKRGKTIEESSMNVPSGQTEDLSEIQVTQEDHHLTRSTGIAWQV